MYTKILYIHVTLISVIKHAWLYLKYPSNIFVTYVFDHGKILSLI